MGANNGVVEPDCLVATSVTFSGGAEEIQTVATDTMIGTNATIANGMFDQDVVNSISGIHSMSIDPTTCSVQDAAALAASAAEEGQRALEGLPPIPAVVVAHMQPKSNRELNCSDWQAEVTELKEAQSQLQRDVEQLRLAKLSLQHARRLHTAHQLAPEVTVAPELTAPVVHGKAGRKN